MITAKDRRYIEGVLASDPLASQDDVLENLLLTGLDRVDCLRLLMHERPKMLDNPFHQIDWDEYLS